MIKIDEDYGAVLSHSTSREVRCLRSSIVLSQVGVKRPTEIQGLAGGRPVNRGQNGTFCPIKYKGGLLSEVQPNIEVAPREELNRPGFTGDDFV